MSAGIGALSSLGTATEAVAKVGETSADVYLPILSEGIKVAREAVASGSIVGDSMVQAVASGIITAEGPITMEVEGSVSGQMIYYWNGPDGYDVDAVDATMGKATAAPTGSAGAGGTLAAGTYKYKTSTVLQRTRDSKLLIMPAGTESSGITTASSNLTANLTIAVPSGLPAGHTHYGTIIWRTAAGGANDSEKFLHLKTGTGTSFADDGSYTLDTAVSPYTTALYRHTLIGSPPVSGDRLEAFTVLINKNVAKSQQYVNCRCGSMKLSVGGPNEKLTGEFNIVATEVYEIDNFSPSFVPLEPFVGWQSGIDIDGVGTCNVESFSLDCNNGLVPQPGLCMKPFNRDNISGKREVKLSFNRQFEDHVFWNRLLAGTTFTFKFCAYGESVTTTSGHSLNATDHEVVAVPFQFYMEVECTRCKLSEAGGNISGPDRIQESIGFQAFKDVATSTELKITLWNSTSLYA